MKMPTEDRFMVEFYQIFKEELHEREKKESCFFMIGNGEVDLGRGGFPGSDWEE